MPLIRAGNAVVSDAFCESRLGGQHGAAFGTLNAKTNFDALITRAFPG